MLVSIRSLISSRLRTPLLFLSVLGPGIITANAGNDAGGIATHTRAGADFGLETLWIFVPLCVALIVVQEMANRMGVVTGKGLSDLIRERFGVKITFALMSGLLLTNLTIIAAEFAGVAAAAELFGIARIVAVPIAALAIWALVLRGTYKTIEKVFLAAALFYLSYIAAGIIVKPDPGEVARALLVPRILPDRNYIVMLIALLGTTVTPWMLFYQQSSVAEKGVHIDNYRLSKIDTITGCIAVMIVAVFMVIVSSETLYKHGISVETAADAAKALGPIAGKWAGLLFAVGLLNASLFAASILPLSTSYTICEGFGWESGLSKSFGEAKQFYVLFTVLIVIGAGFVLFQSINLIAVMYISQVINGVVLPVVLVFMLRLINDPKLMGKRVNSRFYNWICYLICGATALLTITAVIMPLLLPGDEI
ncbi:MAG: Nramp family divalent metal transporter [Candidatus Alcyoniella australis]|nr:Nramp family divalent metal transporter [Candidatus Alcyoniella australis]